MFQQLESIDRNLGSVSAECARDGWAISRGVVACTPQELDEVLRVAVVKPVDLVCFG